jgi:hypothetical protein
LAADNANLLPRPPCYIRVDYLLALKHLGGDQLVNASIVVTTPPTFRPSQDAFYRWLEHTGWKVHRHPPLRTGNRFKENEAAVDGNVRQLIRNASADRSVESIVLLGGDGGYSNAVHSAVHAGKKVFVVAHEGTINQALAEVATAVATLEELALYIGRVSH